MLVITIVPEAGFSTKDQNLIINLFARHLGSRMKIVIEIVSQYRCPAIGKVRLCHKSLSIATISTYLKSALISSESIDADTRALVISGHRDDSWFAGPLTRYDFTRYASEDTFVHDRSCLSIHRVLHRSTLAAPLR